MIYEEKLKQSRKYLAAISMTYKFLLRSSVDKSNKKMLQKQGKLFDALRKKKNVAKFEKGTVKNLKNNDDMISINNLREEVKKIFNGCEYSMFITVLNKIKERSLQETLNNLAQEYIQTLKNIKMYETSIANEQQRKEEQSEKRAIQQSTPTTLTEEQINQRKLKQYDQKISENADRIINGPKKNKILNVLNGFDVNAYDIEYLYGLSMDILVLMDKDQKVEVNFSTSRDTQRVYNTYISCDSNLKYKQDQIFKKYGVNSLYSLLNKYDKIRNQYFKKYSKLSKDKKLKYAFSHFDATTSLDASYNLKTAYENEKFDFPPTKDILIKLMNSRIMNGVNYRLVTPKETEISGKIEPLESENYYDTLKYYRNLTKNMSIDEIGKLYSRVVSDIGNINKKASYEYMIQKLFCALIFSRKDMKISDYNQYESQLSKIAVEVLKEKSKFYNGEQESITKENREKRTDTIYKEYLKYYASEKSKHKLLKFSQFAQRYYGVEHIIEPETLSEDLKGIKR